MCMPAPGDGIQMRFDEIDKTSCACNISTVQQTSRKINKEKHKSNNVSKKASPKSHKINLSD